MKQHAYWWKRVFMALIRNKTREEISEATWRRALVWLQTEARTLAMDDESDFDDAALLELSQVINEELNS